MSDTYGLGLHISLDDVVFSVQHKNALVNHWNECPAKVNNLYATENRLAETIPLAATWLRTYPQTRWILRLHPDNGNHAKSAYKDPLALYARFKPYHEMGFTMMLDNESDFSTAEGAAIYAKWTADYLQAAGDNKHSTAWGRFAVGTIKEDYYPLFKTCLLVNARYGDLHDFSSNEYINHFGENGGSGAIARYKRMWEIADNAKPAIRRPRTSIGEFGWLRNYDPERGFRGAGMPEVEYIQKLDTIYQQWYQPDGVPVSIYMFPEGVPPWNEMGLSIGALGEIRRLAKLHPDKPVVIVEPEPETPSLPYKQTAALLRNGASKVNVRQEKTVASADLGDIFGGMHIGYIWPPETGEPVEGNTDWVRVLVNSVEGYASTYYLLLPEMDTPPTEPEEPPIPAPCNCPTADEIRQIVREENAAMLQMMVDVFTHLQAIQNSSAQFVTLTLTELDDAIEKYKRGNAA